MSARIETPEHHRLFPLFTVFLSSNVPNAGSQTRRTRNHLVRIIAAAVRLQLRYLSQVQAEAIADTVLGSTKAAGLAIRRRRQSGACDGAIIDSSSLA